MACMAGRASTLTLFSSPSHGRWPPPVSRPSARADAVHPGTPPPMSGAADHPCECTLGPRPWGAPGSSHAPPAPQAGLCCSKWVGCGTSRGCCCALAQGTAAVSCAADAAGQPVQRACCLSGTKVAQKLHKGGAKPACQHWAQLTSSSAAQAPHLFHAFLNSIGSPEAGSVPCDARVCLHCRQGIEDVPCMRPLHQAHHDALPEGWWSGQKTLLMLIILTCPSRMLKTCR